MSNHTSDFQYSYFRSEEELRAGVLIWQIVSPILLVCGTLGNVLSVIVLSRKNMIQSVSSTYLRGLSLADLSALWVGLLRQWIRYLGFEIRTTANWVCKMHWWFIYVTLDTSVWLLVMVTVERLVTTFKPITNRILCTKKRAQVAIGAIVVTALVINCHLLYGMELKVSESEGGMEVYTCGPSEDYVDFFVHVWNYFDLCIFSLLPFSILLPCNMGIIYKVISNNRKIKTQVVPLNSTVTDNKIKSMSKLLLTLNFVFIATTAPVCVYLIGEPYWIPKEVPRDIQLEDPWWAVVNMLMYTNNTVNFLMYCVSGSKFRKELISLYTRGHNEETNLIPRPVNAGSSNTNQQLTGGIVLTPRPANTGCSDQHRIDRGTNPTPSPAVIQTTSV